jgi:hypothetical protein
MGLKHWYPGLVWLILSPDRHLTKKLTSIPLPHKGYALILNSDMSNHDHLYFPENYNHSRQTFHDLVKGMGESGSWQVPSRTDTDLFTDHVYLPSRKQPKRLFVVLSGIHGLEGYTGAAIQFMMLKEFLPRLDFSETGILIVHAMNPYGFKHHRRATENQVNLNRNCSVLNELYRTSNPGSLDMSQRFIPKTPVTSLESFMLSRMQRQGDQVNFDGITLDQFVKTVGQGQWESPDGLEYGGSGPEPQVKALIERLRPLFAGCRDLILFDLHTGLGERRRLHLLRGELDGCVHPTLFAELFSPAQDVSIYDYTPYDTEGFYHCFGLTNHLLPELAEPGQRCNSMTLEFGTLGHDLEAQLDALNRWLLEHQGALYGFANEQIGDRIKALYLERFLPGDPEWKANVIKTAREFFNAVFIRAGILRT